MNEKKEELRQAIANAWVNYHDLHRQEAEDDYSDALEGYERKEAEGYADGLSVAFTILFGEEIKDESPNFFDPYAEEREGE